MVIGIIVGCGFVLFVTMCANENKNDKRIKEREVLEESSKWSRELSIGTWGLSPEVYDTAHKYYGDLDIKHLKPPGTGCNM